jgi:hypothetical protein
MKRSQKHPPVPLLDECQQRRAFVAFLLPVFSREWLDQVTSTKPDWMYAAFLHRRMLELEEEL